MADSFGNMELMTQVLMAPMEWATRVLHLAVQDKTALNFRIGFSETESLKLESRVIVDQTSYGEDIYAAEACCL
jgi:hypothetical protein